MRSCWERPAPTGGGGRSLVAGVALVDDLGGVVVVNGHGGVDVGGCRQGRE